MSDKHPLPEFAQTIPISVVAVVCGISTLAVLSQYLLIACLLGLIGVATGIFALKTQVEKLEKMSAIIGIFLSFIPMIYALVILIRK